MKFLVKEMPKNQGTYKYYLDLNVANWKKGKYEILVYQDYGQMILKKGFKL